MVHNHISPEPGRLDALNNLKGGLRYGRQRGIQDRGGDIGPPYGSVAWTALTEGLLQQLFDLIHLGKGGGGVGQKQLVRRLGP